MANLAATYRPSKFEDVCEQSVIVNMLRNICEQDQINHRNFLFIGPAGTGKTTLGRIVANTLNDNKGEPIEIDAASNNGVDSARELVRQMRSFPVGCKYKVFIIDECFPGNTFVHTSSGMTLIKDIKPGMRVYNMTGEATVTHVFCNKVKTANLVCITVNGKPIVTTRDHLFFTDDGWVCAKDLKSGDILYDYKEMQAMRKYFSSDVSERRKGILQQSMQIQGNVNEKSRKTCFEFSEALSHMRDRFLDSEVYKCNNLWNEVWIRMEEKISKFGEKERITCETLAIIYLSNLQQANGDTDERSSKDMFSSMCRKVVISETSEEFEKTSCDEILRSMWKFIQSELRRSYEENMQQRMSKSTNFMEEFDTTSRNLSEEISTNEGKQSDESSRCNSKNESYKEKEWYIDSEFVDALWERTLFQSSDSFENRIREGVDLRISCNYSHKAKQQSESLSYELQTRPCLTKIETRDRGGWDRPQYEIATTIRRKENQMFGKTRVDSVEIYQPGYNDELFQSSFPDTEICNAEYVNMYDLEIDGHPSYYVEDILVHNCHSLSSQAWQIFLKPIEEQPAKTIIILCTTNPEKIPSTILSRVQTFQLSKISLDGIIARLKHIIDQENIKGENITYTDDAVSYIAKLANGGMRDSITLLEKSLSYSNDINIENLTRSLDLPNYDDYFVLLNGIAKKDNTVIVKLIHDVYNSGVNFVKWFEGFHSFVSNIIKYIFIQNINATMIPSHYQDKISNYGTAHATLCLKLANKLTKMNHELKSTQYLQELAITYLCQMPQPKRS